MLLYAHQFSPDNHRYFQFPKHFVLLSPVNEKEVYAYAPEPGGPRHLDNADSMISEPM